LGKHDNIYNFEGID